MSWLKQIQGMLGTSAPSNPFVGTNLLTQAQANQAAGPALAEAGMNLLANSGWSTMPQSLGANLGKAGQAGLAKYNQGLQQHLGLQDLAAKRAAAQTAATRSAWGHDQKVKQSQGIGDLAKQLGLPSGTPANVVLEYYKRQKPQSAIAKLQADLAAKRITLEQYNIGVRNLSRPATTIEMKTTPDFTRKSIGAEVFKAAADKNSAAGRKLANLSSMSQLLATGAPTGRVLDASLPIREVFDAFGLTDRNIPVQQAINSLGHSLALEQHGVGRGPMTDKDFDIYKGIVPGLKNKPAGNALIMRRMQRELIGDQVYYQVVNEMSRQGLDKIEPAEAWRETARLLDADPRVGPLIPNYKTVADAEADPRAIGKVVTIGKITRGQKPQIFFIQP